MRDKVFKLLDDNVDWSLEVFNKALKFFNTLGDSSINIDELLNIRDGFKQELTEKLISKDKQVQTESVKYYIEELITVSNVYFKPFSSILLKGTLTRFNPMPKTQRIGYDYKHKLNGQERVLLQMENKTVVSFYIFNGFINEIKNACNTFNISFNSILGKPTMFISNSHFD
jgi:hypothetical protein